MGQIQFATQSYTDTSLPVSSQRLVNMFAERCPPDAKTQVAVKGCPGVVSFGSAGDGPIRGFNYMGGVLYLVSDTSLYSMSSTGTATFLGSIISGASPVSMDNNGTQLVVVNGVHGYVYSVSGGFVVINDGDFNAAKTVKFLDQRFVFDWAGTNKFFISDTLDGTSYNALAFASAESRPDNVLAVEVHQEILLVFGDKTIEPHQNVGAANFPFERVPGGVIERGLAAAKAIAGEDNTVFFLGEDRIFYKLSGMSITRISTHALEHEWERYDVVSDAVAYSYTFAGHKFIGVTFPTSARTFEFDIATAYWHERQSWDLNGNPMGCWRFNCMINAYGKTLVGDAFSGTVGYLSDTTYTELGNTMQGLAVSPPIHHDRKRVFHAAFELDIESGVGIASVSDGNDTYTKVLLHCDGADASTTITDSNVGGSAHVWTASGNAQIDTSQLKFGTASLLCDGTGDQVTTPDSTDFTLGSSDFTVDFWFTCAAAGGTQMVICGHVDAAGGGSTNTTWYASRETTNVIRGTVVQGSTQTSVTGTTQFTSTVNTGWHHVAFVRTGNVLKLFIDGVQEGSNTAFTGSANNSTAALGVGGGGDFTNIPWNGWVDEFRLSVGIARWTAGFMPPTAVYGTSAGQGSDPQIMLDWSDDKGHSYTDQQQWSSMGAGGAYNTRLRWTRLGQSRDRRYRITVSDPVPRTIMAAHADLMLGI